MPMTNKETVIKTLTEEDFDVSDTDHVLMLKNPANEQTISRFETRLTELDYQGSYGWIGTRTSDEPTESEETNELTDTEILT